MRLLLDTHILLWTITKSRALPKQALALIESPDNMLFTSVANIWEVAIKHARARGTPWDVPLSGEQLLQDLTRADAEILSILPQHAAMVGRLPGHHGDPFDRILIAQAQVESMHLLTHDKHLGAYGDFVICV